MGKDLNEYTHRPVADFFVRKNPDKSLAEQDRIKERLLLYPRGSYKSTLNICDCVQWIICFPDIRILVLTGADDLAVSFVDELKEYFIQKDPPTLFQELFPEHVLDPRQKGNQGEFRTPAQTTRTREPTVFASSILANNSGWHVDVMKPDDVVTDKNSETENELQKITRKFKMVRKLLMPWGYRDTIGTPYSLNDCYADLREVSESYRKKTGKEVIKTLRRPAWWLKGTDYQLPTVEQTENEAGLDLLFPDVLNYEFLRLEQHKDIFSFHSQFLCDPIGANEVIFTLEEMRAHTVPHTQLPQGGKYFVAWDLAYSSKKGRDYTVGAVGLFDEQHRLYIVDIIRARFAPSELAYQIPHAQWKYKPIQTGVEDSTGARWLEPEFQRHAALLGVDMPIDWILVNRTKEAKEERIRALQAHLAAGRLWFAASIPVMDDLYKEFVQFPNGHHDDIPDACAHLLRYMPNSVLRTPDEQFNEVFRTMQDNALKDLIYGSGAYAPKEPEPEPQEPQPSYPYPELFPDLGGGLNG